MWPIAAVAVVLTGLVGWIMLGSGSLQGETVYDAGLIRIETSPFKIYHEFELTNVTGSSITIEGSRATCGCTEFVEPHSVIESGEVIVIPVSLELKVSGRKKEAVVLMLDDGSRVNLVMAATVERVFPVAVSPDPLDYSGTLIIPFMDVEWPGEGPPPAPVFDSSDDIVAEAKPWRLRAKANSSTGRPAIYTARLRVKTPDTVGSGTLTVQVGGLPATTVEVIWMQPPTNESPGESGPVAPAASPSTTVDTAPAEGPAG